MRTSLLAGLLIVGAAAWTALPIALGAVIWLTPAADDERVQSWIDVEVNSAPVTRDVGLALSWQADGALVAPTWAGTVTAVYTQPGSDASTGTPLLSVDGIDRIGAHTASPFFRSVTRSDEGADVAELNTMLASLGMDSNVGSDEFNLATLRGVRALAEKLKVADAAEVETFDPGWIVFLPTDSVRISDVPVVVGSPAPAAGDTILEVPGGLREVRLVDSVDAAAAEDSEVASSDSEGEGNSTAGSIGSDQPLPTVVAGEGESLAFAGVTLDLTSERDAIAPNAIATILPLLDGQPSVVTGSLVSAATGWVVPSAAVRQTSSGLCVVARSAENEPRGIDVESVGSRIGVSIVSGALTETDLVLVGALEPDDNPCSS